MNAQDTKSVESAEELKEVLPVFRNFAHAKSPADTGMKSSKRVEFAADLSEVIEIQPRG